jgi:hypothetical protein
MFRAAAPNVYDSRLKIFAARQLIYKKKSVLRLQKHFLKKNKILLTNLVNFRASYNQNETCRTNKQGKQQQLKFFRRLILKIILTVFFCLFINFGVLAQTNAENKNLKEEKEVSVEEIYLARDDGKGNPGATVEKFSVNDRPVYCIIQLNTEKPVTVKMIFVAAKADRLKPETKIITVSYTTKENENGVTFNASPDGLWMAGEYRIDVYVNNKLAKSRAFEIGNPKIEFSKDKTQTTPKSFAPRKKIKKTPKN